MSPKEKKKEQNMNKETKDKYEETTIQSEIEFALLYVY